MKRIKASFFGITVKLALLCAVLLACGGSPASVSAQSMFSQPDELDAAIREASDYLNEKLPKENKLVILNIQSEFPALSEYIIDELIANTVNDRSFILVDRQQLSTIRTELNFQMSGEVDDATAQSVGRMAGAQIIISGAVSRIGSLYRLRIRALSVESAQIAGQFNRNIPDGPTVSALVRSQATGYGEGTPPASVASGAGSGTPAPEAATPQAIPPAVLGRDIKAYRLVNTKEFTTANPGKMMGTEYQHGFYIGYNGGSTYYNIGAKYTNMSGLYGPMDDSGEDTTLTIYGDEKTLATFEIKSGDMPKQFNLNIAGITQIRFGFSGHVFGKNFCVADVTLF